MEFLQHDPFNQICSFRNFLVKSFYEKRRKCNFILLGFKGNCSRENLSVDFEQGDEKVINSDFYLNI